MINLSIMGFVSVEWMDVIGQGHGIRGSSSSFGHDCLRFFHCNAIGKDMNPFLLLSLEGNRALVKF